MQIATFPEWWMKMRNNQRIEGKERSGEGRNRDRKGIEHVVYGGSLMTFLISTPSSFRRHLALYFLSPPPPSSLLSLLPHRYREKVIFHAGTFAWVTLFFPPPTFIYHSLINDVSGSNRR